MKNYRLVKESPLELHNENLGGLPWKISRDGSSPETPAGFSYVEELPYPGGEELPDGKQWIRNLTSEVYGWIQGDQEVIQINKFRAVASWRLRAVARVTPFLDGVLIDYIKAEIENIQDELQRAVAEEVFFGSNTIDRESVLLKDMAQRVGINSSKLDDLFSQAVSINV